MKILMLNYEYPPLGGGAALVTYYILKELAKYEELEIDLVTSSTDKFKLEAMNERIKIHYLNINKKNKNIHFQTVKDLLTYIYKSLKYCRGLKKKKKYDFIHAFFTVPCGYVAYRLKLPYIISLQGSDVPFYNKRFKYLDMFVLKNLSRDIWSRSSSVTSNSEGLTDLAKKTKPDLDIKLIYNGVDLDEFKQKEYNEKYDKIVLVSTGRLIKRKGYDYLIRALEGLNDFRLILIGSGNIENELKELAGKLMVEADFKGAVSHDEIINYLTTSDIFVLPSLNEGMSISLLEAISCGLPAIVTDVGGSKELVTDNGFVVEKGSVDELRNALLKYKNDKQLIKKHGIKSRMVAQKMSWSNIVKQYLDIYGKIVNKI